jgi:hypothetical protein
VGFAFHLREPPSLVDSEPAYDKMRPMQADFLRLWLFFV